MARGFRVTTNSTFFSTADPARMRPFFDRMMELGVEGMMISPGYPYEKAPDQNHFLHRSQTTRLFQRLFHRARRSWRFNQSPVFLEFLRGNYELECTPWGNPTYNVFGWQKPCYLIQEGYAATFDELMNSTAVDQTFGSLRGLWTAARVTLFGLRPLHKDPPSDPHHKPGFVGGSLVSLEPLHVTADRTASD